MLTISVISSDPSMQRWQCPIYNGDYGSSEPWISEINGFQARYLGPDSTPPHPPKKCKTPSGQSFGFLPYNNGGNCQNFKSRKPTISST